MSVHAFEAAAQLAVYGNAMSLKPQGEVLSLQAYTLAGRVALRDGSLEPAQALELASQIGKPESLPAFADWEQDQDEAAIALRIDLQERFASGFGTALARVESQRWLDGRYARRRQLGYGRNMRGYAVGGPGPGSVLRVSNDIYPAMRVLHVESILTRVLPLRGIPRTEQLQAIDYTGATGASRIPGKPYRELRVHGLRQVTDRHLSDALQTLRLASEAGVRFDHTGRGHDLFDSSAGFGFFDPLDVYPGRDRTELLERNIEGFRSLLCFDIGIGSRRLTKACDGILKRFNTIVAGIVTPNPQNP